MSACIRQRARALGFDSVGIAPAHASAHAAHYARWVEAGYAGEMGYLAREDAIAKRADPALVVPGARSAVVVARSYFTAEPAGEIEPAQDPARAVFARYARNDDYHELLKERLIELQAWIDLEVTPVGGRAYVDTGPVLERELARRAGLGWLGKNCMFISPSAAATSSSASCCWTWNWPTTSPSRGPLRHLHPLPRRLPHRRAVGRARRRAGDGRPRCISYLTIELKGPIPRELRPLIGNRIYGCDICQEVCPHNSPKFVQITPEEAFRPREGCPAQSSSS